ncbi:hypothetical protein BN1708_012236 [Verticillium longisporum]|uniref:Fatty acid desaturase domain-containing protein n=1 Tax=Verticillium longisporum TaxID=100787 RepID=A0A0G4L8Q4_VERLO|nr:hypothetical protein BN1708_012236 [Verticillium longisporum]
MATVTRQRTSTTTATATVVLQPQKSAPVFPDIQTIRNTIPAHCFEPSLWTSFYYVFRDLSMVTGLVWAALTFIPTIPNAYLRFAAWMAYGFVQGLVCTGVWILGHECGHGAFSTHTRLNDCVGWALHSFLLPSGLGKYFRVSHFEPTSAVFRSSEVLYVAITDIGLALMFTALYYATQALDLSTVLFLYAVPYFWVHHWLVAITYLHHNHPDVPHFNEEGWTFVKGALATVDREFGFIGKHLFHGIIEKHVVHHLFPRIPFYKADEATEAMKPLLGDLYIRDDRSFLGQLWSVFGTLHYVENDPDIKGNMRWVKN